MPVPAAQLEPDDAVEERRHDKEGQDSNKRAVILLLSELNGQPEVKKELQGEEAEVEEQAGGDLGDDTGPGNGT